MINKEPPFPDKFRRDTIDPKPKEIFDLGRKNDDSNAAGKANYTDWLRVW